MGTMQAAHGTGTYLYAVTSGLTPPATVLGIQDGKVYTIESGDLQAVVSDLQREQNELRPERRNVAAHQQVLREVTQSSPKVLPVAFGTIAESPEGVKELLDRYHDDLADQLQLVDGKQQLAIRVVYGGRGTIFDYVVSQDADLRQARDELAHGAPTREQKIEVGQRFEAALSALRERCADALEKVLCDRCSSLKRLPPRTEQELARLACLVPAQNADEWEKGVREAAGQLPDAFTVEISGPLPPYDFVDLRLQA